MKKHIMAIGAHIGDAELTCGKTLATHAKKGDDITIVAITAGERGAPPDRTTAPARTTKVVNTAVRCEICLTRSPAPPATEPRST